MYSGLDLSRYSGDGRSQKALRNALGLPDLPGPWVGWVGRFSPQKDPATFLRAARLIRERIPTAQFVVAGEDPPIGFRMDRDVRLVAGDLGLNDVVHFVGFRRDIATVLRSVDLVLHSSRYEGMGRVVCEAMACERPVVGTAVDGVVEAILSRERGGILVPAGDAEGLALGAEELLRNKDFARSLARVGREWVERNLSQERMVADIEATYLDILADPARESLEKQETDH